MHPVFYTLHSFLLHTESITYLVMLISLLSILGFWFFLTERDNDQEEETQQRHQGHH